MKSSIKILLVIFSACLVFFSNEATSQDESLESEPIICPGSGERCAQVELWGVGLWWKKKEKGGPGVIIPETVE